MATGLVPPSISIASTDGLYRGINPKFYVAGQVTTGVFCLKKRDMRDDAPSVGLEKLIPLPSFRNVIAAGWGVGEFAADIPQRLGLTVIPHEDASWGEYSHAHAVIDGYQFLGKKRMGEVERFLTNAVRQNVIVIPEIR
jgi:hypothetical protein